MLVIIIRKELGVPLGTIRTGEKWNRTETSKRGCFRSENSRMLKINRYIQLVSYIFAFALRTH